MTQFTTKEHIARATIEAVCFQTRAILDAMARDSGTALNMLAVDGGMSNSDESMQIQADILGTSLLPLLLLVAACCCCQLRDSRLTACKGLEIDRPQMRETTALGAAIAAGFAVGVWKEFSELKGINRDGRTTFRPKTTEASREKLYANWERAVERSKGWLNNDRVDDDDVDG